MRWHSSRYLAARRRLAAMGAALVLFTALTVPSAQAHATRYCKPEHRGFFNPTVYVGEYHVGSDAAGWKRYRTYEHTDWFGARHKHWETNRCGWHSR